MKSLDTLRPKRQNYIKPLEKIDRETLKKLRQCAISFLHENIEKSASDPKLFTPYELYHGEIFELVESINEELTFRKTR